MQRQSRHDDAHSSHTKIAGVQVKEVAGERHAERIIVIRQRIAERVDVGGKTLFDPSGFRLRALITISPASEFDALAVRPRYNGRAEIENHLDEMGRQFGINDLCRQKFWATWRPRFQPVHAVAAWIRPTRQVRAGDVVLVAIHPRGGLQRRQRQGDINARSRGPCGPRLESTPSKKIHRVAQLSSSRIAVGLSFLCVSQD